MRLGLEAMTFDRQHQRLLLLVVESIVVENSRVHIGTIIPTGGGGQFAHTSC